MIVYLFWQQADVDRGEATADTQASPDNVKDRDNVKTFLLDTSA